MNTLWISLCVTILLAFANAQRNLNISKPIVNLEKRKPPTWQRPTEERRKLSIFPRTTRKYIVTPKTVVKPDDETGLPTKRPLMRKFVVQDKNEKGSWYFAPREPLMKTKRFTVNSNKPHDEIDEESRNTKTVKTKNQLEHGNVKLNKGNVNAFQNYKANLSTSKSFKPIEKVVEEAKSDNQLMNQSFKINDVVKKESPELLSDSHRIDVPNLDSAGSNQTQENEGVNKTETIKIIESISPLNTTELFSERIESRSLDNEMAFDQSNDSLKKPHSNNSLNGLEELLNIFNNENDKLAEGEPALDDGKNNNTNQNPNEAMDDILLRKLIMDTTNIQEMNLLNNNDTPITEVSQALDDGDVNVMSETLDLNNETNMENLSNVDGLQSFINLIKNDVIAKEITKMKSEIPILLENQQNFELSTIAEYTIEPLESELEFATSTNIPIVQNLNLGDVLSSLSKTINSDNLGNTSAENISVETDSSKNLSQEHSHEASGNESNSESDEYLSAELDATNETSNESNIDKSNNLTGKDISNDSVINGSSALEEDANETIQDVSNNLTNEDILNESNMATEETLNEASSESIIDKSINLTTEDISTEMVRDVSSDLTVEDILNESNMAGEDISNESLLVGDNTSEGVTFESVSDVSNNLTTEDITNESNISGEQISNESVSDNSNNASEKNFNDSLVVKVSVEETSDESVNDKSSNLSGEDATEYIETVPNVSAAEIPVDVIGSRYKRSNNIIEEEYQATTIGDFKYTGQPTRLSQDLSFKNINA